MHVIAGLGNPGRAYKDTRHNAGFMAVEDLARITGIRIRGFRFKARTGSGKYQGDKIFILKPRTYMNLSGKSVRACLEGLKLGPENLVVIHDDLDLPPGRIRVKRDGGAGGHRGIQSIIDELGTDRFARVRIGIGKPDRDEDPVDYVLEPFAGDERRIIKEAIERGARAALAVVFEGIDAAMNNFNSK